MPNSCIWPKDRILSRATTPVQSEPGSDVIEWVLRIPQSSNITGASQPDCLMAYPGHSLLEVVPLCIDVVDVFYNLHKPTGLDWLVDLCRWNPLPNSSFFGSIYKIFFGIASIKKQTFR